MKQTKGWIVPHFKQQLWRFAFAALFGTIATACAGALLFTSGYLISRSSLQPENILMVYVPIVLVRTFGFGKAGIQYVYRLLSHDVVLRILAKMRVKLFSLIEPQAVFIRSRFRSGDLLGMLAEDIEQLQHVYLRVVLPTITAIIIYSVGILAIGWFDVPFALLMALYAGVILFGIPFVTLLRSRRQRRRLAKEKSLAYEQVTDAVFGMTDWKLSGRTEHFLEEFRGQQQRMDKPDQRIRRKEWNMQWISQMAIGGAVILMAIWASQWAQNGLIQPEWIAAFTLIVFPLLEEFVRTGEGIARAPDYKVSIERLRQLEVDSLDLAPINDDVTDSRRDDKTNFQFEAVSRSNGVIHSRSNARSSFEARGLQASSSGRVDQSISTQKNSLPSHNVTSDVHLKLSNVTYHYASEEEPAVRDVSLDIPQGNKVAMIGKSGSGKSTLFKLMQGELQPDEGEVTVIPATIVKSSNTALQADEGEFVAADGTSTFAFAQSSGSASVFSVLNQKPYLFDTSIANNIKLARPSATLAEVEKAAALAGLSELILGLPDGLQTRVLESGFRFSGGERQRIALARILLQDTPIVLLDEPTVGLDPIVENELIESIFHALQGKTIVWITHHLRFLEHMDEVIFMENGRVSMQGTHSDLLKENERYRKLNALDQ